MKQLIFKDPGGESPCALQLVFDTGQDAINFLASTIEGFGTKNYFAKFTEKDNNTIVLKLTSPQNKTQVITTPDLKYNSNDFYIFSQAPINKTLFVIMCGIIKDGKFGAVKYKDSVFIEVAGYETL